MKKSTNRATLRFASGEYSEASDGSSNAQNTPNEVLGSTIEPSRRKPKHKIASKLMSSITIGRATKRTDFSGSELESSIESFAFDLSHDFDGDCLGAEQLHRSWTPAPQRSMFPHKGFRQQASLPVTLPSSIAESRAKSSIPQNPMSNCATMGSVCASTVRRVNLNATELTMGLNDDSADFLELVHKARRRDWLKSLSLRDPRFCIKTFFDDIASDGVDSIEDRMDFHPELLSPVVSMFQRSSVFSVWRPTSMDSIRKMMKGHGVGKGLDIKGKSAKTGKLSAFVPFLQIHDEAHKTKIRTLPSDGRIRVFYKKEAPRDNAYRFLMGVMNDMLNKVADAEKLLDQAKRDHAHGEEEPELLVLRSFRSKRKSYVGGQNRDAVVDMDETRDLISAWKIENPSIVKIDDYSPKCFGLDMPKRLFWEGYVMRATDISRPAGSEFDSGRPSHPCFQDMNFASIKDDFDPDSPRAVVWQYTDPYQPPNVPDPDPMLPQTLLMAYEENGRVLPVVSDFDCFLLGTRGVRFRKPLPQEQVEMVMEMVDDIAQILEERSEGKCTSWTASWFENMKSKTTHHPMPKYGFGDPKSYAIMRHAVKRLEEFGAVRHGAECFNYYFPQDLDDEYLVIGGNLDGAKYKYMKLEELQNFLVGCIDDGFTFPLNPKWVLCDKGWKAIWDKLLQSTHPNVVASINVWCPPESGLRERIEAVHKKYPDGFETDVSERKKGTTLWDEAEMALEKYQRIQRAKRKLWVVFCWISIVRQSQKRVQEKRAKMKLVASMNASRDLFHTQRVAIGETPSSVPGIRDRRMATIDLVEIWEEFEVNGIPNRNTDDDVHNDIIAIQTLLNDRRNTLTKSQCAALRRTIVLLGERSKVEVSPRSLRRHTSSSLNFDANEFDNVPANILEEYGDAETCRKSISPKINFRSSVGKIIVAKRFIDLAKSDNSDCSLNLDYLPVEWKRLPLESKKSVARKLSFKSLSSWDFNVHDLVEECKGSPLLFVGWAILGSPHAQRSMAKDIGMEIKDDDDGYDFVCNFEVKLPVLCTFLRLTESEYLPNPYHNSSHAADVVVTLNALLQLGGKKFAQSSLHVFSILVAAVIHDVKHPGLNNNFQINSQSEAAVLYNDVSVLENMSVTWLFSKLIGSNRDFAVDIFSGLNPSQFGIARSVIVRSVLATDMSHHFLMMAKIAKHHEQLADKDCKEWLLPYTFHGCTFNPSLDMLCFILHLADISNPAKPPPMFVRWADAILTELYAQGDKEASMSLPMSPLCDRVSSGKRSSQLGFIKFVVQPAFERLGGIIPEVNNMIIPCIRYSLEFWESYEEADRDNT